MESASDSVIRASQRFNPLDYPLCLAEPRFLSGTSAWEEHIPFAFACVGMLRPRIFVELGTHRGDSYCAFCQGVDVLRLATKCYAIDTWTGDEHTGSYDESVFQELQAYHDPLYGSFSRLIRSTFDEALDHFPDGSIDLLHIDGLHTYEAVRHDFEAWLPKMSARGFVLLHDTNVRERGFGVGKLWAELSRDYPAFEFVHGHGLGVLAVGSEAPEPLRSLMSADQTTTQSVRSVFFELARRKSSIRDTSRLMQNLKTRADEIEGLRTELTARSREAGERESEIECLRTELAARRREASGRADEIERLRTELATRRREASGRADEIERLRAQLEAYGLQIARVEEKARAIKKSIVWRAVKPIWKLECWTRRSRQKAFRKGSIEARHAEARDGLPVLEVPIDRFEAWLGINRWNPRQERHLRQRLAQAGSALPRISILMPVYNAPVALLQRAVESVRGQLLGDWELCIADDSSTEVETHRFLHSLADDARIRVTFRDRNGNIARATNSAASLATGEFLVFLDQDDELSPDCLAEVALHMANNPKTDLLYSDTDKIDERGRRYDPAFKPGWSPELLLSFMYAGQVLAVRRALFEAVGGLRPGFDGSQDHDLALRVGERARHVGHIPKILYHWRSVAGSTARSGNEKPHSIIAGRKAVQEALQRRGSRGLAVQPKWAEQGGYSLFIQEFPDEGPAVTVIIPTKNNKNILQRCIKSLERTTYRNWQTIIIDNESDDPAALHYLDDLDHCVMRVPSPCGSFNFAHLINRGVAAADTDYIVLLNDDTEVVDPRWLSHMMGYAQMEGVGAVGAQLRFPDGRIQHAGVVHGLHDGLAGHAFKLLPQGRNGYMSMVEVPRNCAAVTAACMLTRRSLYLELGGFDEEHLGVAYNDPDYCYRLLERGYRVVYCPNARLLHHEGTSRNKQDDARELAIYRDRYSSWADPYYNPNLSMDDEQFRIQPRCVVLGERRRIRTGVFTHNLNWEGAPYSQLEVVTELKRRGIIEPVVLSPADGPLRSAYEAAECEVIIEGIPIAVGASMTSYRNVVNKLAERVRTLDVEMIHANTLQTYYAVDAARQAAVPMVWNVHESEGWQRYFDFLSPEVRNHIYVNFGYPYRVVFVAHATRRLYKDLDIRHNFTVIHNGLAPGPIEAGKRAYTSQAARQRLGIASLEVMFLLLGTVCERKGQHEFIEAAMQLTSEEWRHTRLCIVGDRPSPYSEDLHVLVSALPEWAQQRVRIVSETDDTALYYRAADVFVCTSRLESYPRVILEAMAYGLPIITTPVFGITEQVQEEVNALFYQPGHPSALAGQMRRLLHDVVLRERMRAASPDVLRSLTSFSDMSRAYTDVFREASLSSVPDFDR